MGSGKSSSIVGSPQAAFPGPRPWTQEEVRRRLNTQHPTAIKMFASPCVRTRHLALLSYGGQLSSDEPHDHHVPSPKSIDKGLTNTSKTGKECDGFASAVAAPELAILQDAVQPNVKDREILFDRAAGQMATSAALNALSSSNLKASQIDVLTAVTSTGLLMPGLSARLVDKVMGFRSNVQRVDIVGMGCNAGLSALRTLAMTLQQLANFRNVRVFGLLVCCEVNSCMFLAKDSPGDGIVNALFGDAAVAGILRADPLVVLRNNAPPMISDTSVSSCSSELVGAVEPIVDLIDFECHTFTDCMDDIKFTVEEITQLTHFSLSKRIPFEMGCTAPIPVRALLARHDGLDIKDIDHFFVHGGGKKVIECLAEGLGIPSNDVATKFRHTFSVLRDYGNLSSGSFLVSLQRLYEELNLKRVESGHEHPSAAELKTDRFCVGQKVLFMAMGPGATVEVALGVVNGGADVLCS